MINPPLYTVRFGEYIGLPIIFKEMPSMFVFNPSGVCAKQILFDVIDGKISNLTFVGGCPGSLEAIARLLDGQELDTVIAALQGITCGKKTTSCPDQLTKVLADIRDGKGDAYRQPEKSSGVFAAFNPFN